VASDLDQAEQPLATEKADAALKPFVARDTLHDVPVNIPDGTQRRIDVRPTSLQDVYYYSARH
jgi:hypothetical protein